MQDSLIIIAVVLFHALVFKFGFNRRSYLSKRTDWIDKILLSIIYVLILLVTFFVVLASLNENAYSNVFFRADVLSASEAAAVVRMAEAEAARRGGWSTSRHRYYPTTDLNAYSIVEPIELSSSHKENFGLWWNTTAEPQMFELLSNYYSVSKDNLYMKDLFVVKYDMAGQRYLPEHQDSSQLTFSVALSAAGRDFTGGGARLALTGRVLTAPRGGALLHESGLFHAGEAVTSGSRYILIGFVNVKFSWDTWYRSFGNLASCVSVVGAGGDAPPPVCRSWAWMVWYLVRRPLQRTYQHLLRGEGARDPTGGAATAADASDYVFTALVLSLLGLLLILFAVLICSYALSTYDGASHPPPCLGVSSRNSGVDKTL